MKLRLALAVAITIVMGAHAAAVPPIPDTQTGRRAAGYLEAFNSGREDALRDFILANVAKSSLAERPLEERLQGLRGVRAEHGHLTPVRVLEAKEDELRILAKNDHGDALELSFLFEAKAPRYLLGMRMMAAAESSPAGPAGASGTSGPRLTEAEAIRSFRAHLDSLSQADAFSGAVLVAKDDAILFRSAYGLASRPNRIPNDAETRFNLGSINKVFTKLAIAQLAEQGKISLDATIDRYLPDYPKPAASKVTVRHLLQHRGGIGDVFGDEYDAADRSRLRRVADWIPLFRNKPLAFEPGSSQQYSNGGYVLLGAIIEKVSGEDYYDYVRRHIYEPLGLKNTDHYANDEKVPNLANGYTKRGGGGERGGWQNNQASRPMRGSPAGGGYSTVDDLFAFTRAIRKGGLVRSESAKDFREFVPGPGGAMGAMFGGGAPGINASVSLEGPYTIIVLANLDPPAAEDVGAKLLSLLGLGGEGRGRVVRMQRPPGHHPPGAGHGVGAGSSGGAQPDASVEETPGGRLESPRKSFVPVQGVSVEMLRSDHSPVVMAMVNGKGPYRFAIDTGAAGSARIDSALAAELGLEKIGQVHGGDPSGRNTRLMDLVAVGSLEIGGARFEGLSAAVRNYNERRLGERVDGILGFALFQDCLFTLDYPAQRVRIERGQLPKEDGREILPFRVRNGVPSVKLQVDSLTVDADVDAGSMGGFSLPEKLQEKLALASEPRVVGRGRTVSNEFEIKAAQLRGTVRLGQNEYTQATVSFQPLFPMANVGARVLKDYEVTFDQKNGRMRLKRGGA